MKHATQRHGRVRSMLRRALVAAPLALLLAVPAAAQAPDVDNPWELGRDAYRAEDFESAARFIIEAIHREPENPQYYLGLARTEYWRGRYDIAVHYYDIYLGELASRVSPNVREADRLDRVREERDSANAARSNPDAAAEAPSGPASARAVVEARLEEGPILTTTGGGAFALYQGMLRAGYAHPDLVQIRSRLAAALLMEADGVVSDYEAAIPQLSLVQWETQRERFAAWRTLVQAPEIAAPVDANSAIPASALDPAAVSVDPWARAAAHMALCDAQIQFLNQNYAEAAEGFRSTLETMPTLIPARMGRLNALYRLGNAAGTVATEIDELEALIDRYAPVADGTADVYRAAFAAQSGDSVGAARRLATLLGIPE